MNGRKRWSFPSPPLVDGSDEEKLITIASVVFPGSVERGANGELRTWVEVDADYPLGHDGATAVFQVVLGVLRARKPDRGVLKVELAPSGAVFSDSGDAVVHAQAVNVDAVVGNELELFAQRARHGIEQSDTLEDALWLNGRPHRTGADYYMILELAHKAFGDADGVRAALDVSAKDQQRLRQSACNLSPRLGGRHATLSGPAPWSLEQQRAFSADLLRRWIEHYEL